MAAGRLVHNVVTRSREEPGAGPRRPRKPCTQQLCTRSLSRRSPTSTDPQTSVDSRRIAAESRPPRAADQSVIGRVWNLLTGVSPSKPALTGFAK